MLAFVSRRHISAEQCNHAISKKWNGTAPTNEPCTVLDGWCFQAHRKVLKTARTLAPQVETKNHPTCSGALVSENIRHVRCGRCIQTQTSTAKQAQSSQRLGGCRFLLAVTRVVIRAGITAVILAVEAIAKDSSTGCFLSVQYGIHRLSRKSTSPSLESLPKG